MKLKDNKPVLFGLIGGGFFLVVALIILLIVFFVKLGKGGTNLSDYITVIYSGVEGHGTARADIDREGLKNDLKEKADDEGALDAAVESVEVIFDKNTDLKNGDVIIVDYRFDENKADEAGVKLVGGKESLTVTGLSQGVELDPFAEVTLEYEGLSPNLTLTVRNAATVEPLSLLRFTADKDKNLKVGDPITVRAEGITPEVLLEEYGATFTQTEKQYTVEQVDSYITTPAEIDDAGFDIMKQATSDCIDEYFSESSRRKTIRVKDIRYFGYYLETNKDMQNYVGVNKVYMVFSATVSSKEKPKSFKATTVYFPVEFNNIKKLKSGNWDIETDYIYLLGSTSLRYGYWNSVDGYTDMDKLKSDLVDANKEGYTAVGVDGLA
ncbi:MAG: hypothetical protein IJL75_00555 [Eubacterium sp.]|nr:hypothetical protein [Eubacterium sp.]